MSTHQIKLYNLFRKELRLSDEKAADFVSAVDDAVGSENTSTMKYLSAKFDGLSGKANGLEKRFDKLEYGFDILENRFDKLENKFDTLETKLETKIDTLETKLETKFDSVRNDISAMDKKFTRTVYGATIWQLIAMIMAVVTIVKFMR